MAGRFRALCLTRDGLCDENEGSYVMGDARRLAGRDEKSHLAIP